MVLANKYFIAGIIVGYILCLLTGYTLLLIDKHKENKRKLTRNETKVIINERSD